MAKKQPANPGVSVETILQDHTPVVRLLVEELRSVIRVTVPEVVEVAHAVWHSINYRHPSQGYFCGLFPQADEVKVAFEFGALLPDPAGLLRGSGKQVRYLHCRPDQELPTAAFRQLIQATLDLPPTRSAKLALLS